MEVDWREIWHGCIYLYKTNDKKIHEQCMIRCVEAKVICVRKFMWAYDQADGLTVNVWAQALMVLSPHTISTNSDSSV